MHVGTTVVALALLFFSPRDEARAQGVAPPTQLATQVLVTIRPDESGDVRVEERFVGVGDSIVQHPRFRALTRACASVQNVQLIDGGRSATLAADDTGVWVEYGESSGTARTFLSPAFELHYVVRGGGRPRDIPLILPAHPIPRTEGMREGSVTVVVESPRAHVHFPQLVRDARTGVWSGHFVAIPSFVRLTTRETATTTCDAPARGDDGGLVWRFGVLVGILVAWVPLYLGWARRATSADA